MTTPQQIADFVSRTCADIPRWSVGSMLSPSPQRPTVEQLAERFRAEAEFEALNLGRFFGTPDGQLLRAAMPLLMPAFAANDADLIIEALQLAATMQSRGKRGIATALTIAAAFLSIGLFMDLSER